MDEKHNPWAVEQLEDFLFFCCPECPDRSPSKETFINHALVEHPQARDIIPYIIETSNDDTDVKNEPADETSEILDSDEHIAYYTDIKNEPVDETSEILESNDYIPHCKKLKKSNRKTFSTSMKSKREQSAEEVQCYYCSEMMVENQITNHMTKIHGRERITTNMYGEKRPYKCSSCDASLKQEAKDTSPLHTCCFDVNPIIIGDGFKCCLCCKIFKKRDRYDRHISTVHNEARRFKCKQCTYAAKTAQLLNKHVKSVHEKSRPHVCDICGMAFYEPFFLKKHQKVHHTPTETIAIIDSTTESVTTEFHCDMCERTFERSRSLAMHKTYSHNAPNTERLPCELCGMAFTTLDSLTKHLKSEHASEEEIAKIECWCLKCDTSYDTSVDLNEHLISSCCDDKRNFKCDTCGKDNWYSAIALRKHIAEIHQIIRHVCDICGVIVRSIHYLKDHKKRAHEGQASHFTCDNCGKVLTSQALLQKHISAVHKKLKPFKCKQCEGAFSCNTLLIRHQQSKHIKSIKYECSHCSYVTYTPGALRTHVRIVHEKAKPNKCDFCEMAFFYKRDKVKHMSKHPEFVGS